MDTNDHRIEATALGYAEQIAAMDDDELRRAYLTSDGESGDPWVEALLLACQSRDIDI